MSMDARDQVERYLAEVEATLVAAGVAEHDDIVGGLREHISAATSTDEGRPVAEVLRELGDPQAITASAVGESETVEPRRVRRDKSWFAITALIALFVGSALLYLVVPVVLVVIGLLMLWLSRVWTVREKLWGTLLVPAPGLAFGIVLGFASGGQSCTTTTSGQDVQTLCTSNGDYSGGVVFSVVLAIVAIVGAAVTIRLARSALGRR